MQEPVLLNEFAELVRSAISAPRLSVLFVSEPWDSQRLLIVHTHDPVVPELTNEQNAATLVSCVTADANEITQIPSVQEDSVLVRFPLRKILPKAITSAKPQRERRTNPDVKLGPDVDGYVWFALENKELCTSLLNIQTGIANSAQVSETSRMASLLVRLAWNVYSQARSLNDPTSHLPGRMELQVFINRVMAVAIEEGQDTSVVLINPDDFSMVNHRYGRTSGDKAIRDMANILVSSLRRTDGTFRYSGAVFAVVLPATNLEQCKLACEKITRQLSGECFVAGNERFTFSVGAISATSRHLNSSDFDSSAFLRRADVALNRAKVMGGATTICASADDASIDDMDMNPLSGVFTADSEKDYRNMALLWESVTMVTKHGSPTAMAEALVDRIGWHMHADTVALFEVAPETPTRFKQIASNVRNTKAPQERHSNVPITLDASLSKLLDRATTTQRVEESSDDDASYAAYVIPLLARGDTIACLLLDNQGPHFHLDSSDLTFLNALVSQFSVALDRARLAADWFEQKDQESRALRAELSELRQTVDSHVLLYESEEMKVLLETVETVAPSEATVLITGESGTGKELIANALHNLSDRADKPFVVFDCGAVATNLIEAELFGHTKGAFTGAESQSDGRIAYAEGGTIFLDEIGELPLDLQTKLLRFVQEKTFSPVGSNSDRQVDVRIVAATNRRLQDEVSQGRFRQDLYYRLQVISLQITPLRHRVNDIMPLAQHFLQRFALQHGKSELEFDVSARHKLLSHSWPGNVRELQHLMLRAVLTSQNNTIEGDDLEFLPEAIASVPSDANQRNHPTHSPTQPLEADHHHPPNGAAPQTVVNEEGTDPWSLFLAELDHQINKAMDLNPSRPVPLGRWLTEDLVLAANRFTGKVAKHGAELLGLPETTFRRHLKKAASEQDAGLTTRTDDWTSIDPLINRMVQAEDLGEHGQNLVERVRIALLDEVANRFPGEITRASALMGVTPPTYKRWLAALSGS